VATARSDGSVHASLVNAGLLDDPVTGAPVVGLVVRGDARKLVLLRASGRASVTFHSGWLWVSVDGPVRIAGPDDRLEGFDAAGLPDLLRRVFRSAGGSHDDWDTYDRVMREEGRAAVLMTVDRVYGN
jgi:hypothetical protein